MWDIKGPPRGSLYPTSLVRDGRSWLIFPPSPVQQLGRVPVVSKDALLAGVRHRWLGGACAGGPVR
jgi:hypothetical protein